MVYKCWHKKVIRGKDPGFKRGEPTMVHYSLGQRWHFHLTQGVRSLTRGMLRLEIRRVRHRVKETPTDRKYTAFHT